MAPWPGPRTATTGPTSTGRGRPCSAGRSSAASSTSRATYYNPGRPEPASRSPATLMAAKVIQYPRRDAWPASDPRERLPQNASQPGPGAVAPGRDHPGPRP
ncbi:MAG: hypothetical protein MZV64_13390 [Ignavibacteriales bacterium]|nr:hypothetical protein [Ignavibacteriales bacterium]